ncbi:hypothetical protein [Pseudalkalibacillus sp. JSM 102089]|uniref:hypothetical protein n=1 Tax=Pseudalkalibacillus sp. JSM 102089 TaxID=3229856 RepID=UPI003524ECEB
MNKKKKSIIVGIVILIGILVSAYEFYQPDRLGQATQVALEEFENDFKDRVGKYPKDINLTSVEKSDSWIIAFTIGDQSPKTEKVAEYEVTEELTIQNSSWYGTVDEDVRKVVWGQLSSDQKDFIDGNWEDGTISKVNLTDSMLANQPNEVNPKVGEEVYAIAFPTKSTSSTNNVIVYADVENHKYIANGLVD